MFCIVSIFSGTIVNTVLIVLLLSDVYAPMERTDSMMLDFSWKRHKNTQIYNTHFLAPVFAEVLLGGWPTFHK